MGERENIMKQLVHSDDKGRMNLGKQFANLNFLVEVLESGKIVLQRAAIIPESELWLHNNKKAMASVQRGLKQAKEGQGTVNAVNLDKYKDQ